MKSSRRFARVVMQIVEAAKLYAAGSAIAIGLAGCGSSASSVPAPTDTPAVNADADSAAAAPAEVASMSAEPFARLYLAEATGSTSVLLISRTAQGDSPEKHWLVRREIFKSIEDAGTRSAAASWREQILVQLPDGSIALKQERNGDDNVVVAFDPPMVLFPPTIQRATIEGDTLAPGFTQNLYVKVHPMKDETKIRVQGPATQNIFFEGEETVVVSGTPITATRIRRVFAPDFGTTTSVNESVEWLAPGIGVIREIRSERTKVLGVQIRNNQESWIAQELP